MNENLLPSIFRKPAPVIKNQLQKVTNASLQGGFGGHIAVSQDGTFIATAANSSKTNFQIHRRTGPREWTYRGVTNLTSGQTIRDLQFVNNNARLLVAGVETTLISGNGSGTWEGTNGSYNFKFSVANGGNPGFSAAVNENRDVVLTNPQASIIVTNKTISGLERGTMTSNVSGSSGNKVVSVHGRNFIFDRNATSPDGVSGFGSITIDENAASSTGTPLGLPSENGGIFGKAMSYAKEANVLAFSSYKNDPMYAGVHLYQYDSVGNRYDKIGFIYDNEFGQSAQTNAAIFITSDANYLVTGISSTNYTKVKAYRRNGDNWIKELEVVESIGGTASLDVGATPDLSCIVCSTGTTASGSPFIYE